MEHSVHVEISFENTLLERIWLPRFRPSLWRLRGRRRHLGDGLGTVMLGTYTARAWRGRSHARTERELRPRASNCAFSAGPKLLRPVEALVIGAGAGAPSGSHVTHRLRTKTHPPRKGSSRGRPGVGGANLVFINSTLINRLGAVGGQAPATKPKGCRHGCRGGARETDCRDRQPSTVVIHGCGDGAGECWRPGRCRVAALKEVGEGS